MEPLLSGKFKKYNGKIKLRFDLVYRRKNWAKGDLRTLLGATLMSLGFGNKGCNEVIIRTFVGSLEEFKYNIIKISNLNEGCGIKIRIRKPERED